MIVQLIARFLLFMTARYIFILISKSLNVISWKVQMAPYKKSYYLTEDDFN